MLRGFMLGIIFTVLAAVAVGYYALSSGLIPANADAKPGRIEMFLAGKSLQATPDKDAPKDSNPVQLTDEKSAASSSTKLTARFATAQQRETRPHRP